jgi:hypothetical protein
LTSQPAAKDGVADKENTSPVKTILPKILNI